jgi:hypothetical protein
LIGRPTISWNGLGFDYRAVAMELDEEVWRHVVATMALKSIDPMFSFLCGKGYRLGLEKACVGNGVEGKMEGMHGDLAPLLWNPICDFEITEEQTAAMDALGVEPGSQEARQLVLEYVEQNIKALSDLYEAILPKGQLEWTSNSGNPMKWFFGDSVLPVNLAILEPLVDVTWMDNPDPRRKFYGWVEEYGDLVVDKQVYLQPSGENEPYNKFQPNWLCRNCKTENLPVAARCKVCEHSAAHFGMAVG